MVAVASAEDLRAFQQLVRMVPIADALSRYVVDLVRATRPKTQGSPEFVRKYVNYGASVRAAQFIVLAAKARALSHKRYHVGYDDITSVAVPVLRHRILLNFHAESDGMDADAILHQLIAQVQRPKETWMQRFLDPNVLAGISTLDLLAKTVVDGFVAGLPTVRRTLASAREFAEYRAYVPGDDLRHVDWNLFARTERCYLKRYRGETNSQLTVLLDASNSMLYTSGPPKKMDYARYLAASLFYLAIHNQRDAAGLIVFDDEVREYIRPATRTGQLARLFAGLERAEPRALTDFGKPMKHLQNFLRRRGIVIVISDFYEQPETIVRTVAPLRFHGNEVVLLHILGSTVRFVLCCAESAILVDLETDKEDRSGPRICEDRLSRQDRCPYGGASLARPIGGDGLSVARHRSTPRSGAARVSFAARQAEN